MLVFQSTPNKFSIKPILLVTVMKQLTTGFVMEPDSVSLMGSNFDFYYGLFKFYFLLWTLSFTLKLHLVCNHMGNSAFLRDIRS